MLKTRKFANEVSKGDSSIKWNLENYPDLKASTNIGKVQDASLEIEENLQASKEDYIILMYLIIIKV